MWLVLLHSHSNLLLKISNLISNRILFCFSLLKYGVKMLVGKMKEQCVWNMVELFLVICM